MTVANEAQPNVHTKVIDAIVVAFILGLLVGSMLSAQERR
jgi:hypothetical protein